MKTASFSLYQGPGRISIARFAPRGTPAGYKVYKPLAPGPWFNSVSYERYRELYFDQLAKLDAQQVWDTLHKLADGHEPVVLCYERPPFTQSNFCHRRMVAEWLKTELGFDVNEMVTTPAQNQLSELNVAVARNDRPGGTRKRRTKTVSAP